MSSVRIWPRLALALLILSLMGCATGGGPNNMTSAPEPKPVLIRMHACSAASQPGLHDVKAHASRSGRDYVAWYNGTSSTITITFGSGMWPFNGSASSITVQPGETSSWYRVDRHASLGDHKYVTIPSVHPCPTGTPGEPAVVVDD